MNRSSYFNKDKNKIMTIIRKEYFTNYIWDLEQHQFVLPDWFTKASLKYKKIIRVLGASCGVIQSGGNETDTSVKGLRLMSNLTKDFPPDIKIMLRNYDGSPRNPPIPDLFEGMNFIMIVNNYNNVKEYDVTLSDLKHLTWGLMSPGGGIATFNGLDLVIEMELMITQEDVQS
jgi:hypothetical protein